MAHVAPDGFHIRPATEADCPAITAIYNFYVRTSPATFDTVETTEADRLAWFRQRSQSGFPVLLAVHDASQEVVGWCALAPWSSRAAYDSTAEESIYIADGFRRHGLGRALLAAILEEARGLGKHVVMAGVTNCQDASIRLHESLGFERAGLYRHMGFKLGEWHDVAYLQRHLWPG